MGESSVNFLRPHLRGWLCGLCWAGLLAINLCGCGKAPESKSSVKKAPVSGTVTMGGKPLEGAEVYFNTEKFTGFAKTNAEGKYQLSQGAAIGANKVFISKLDGAAATANAADPTLALNDPTQTQIAGESQSKSKKGPKQLIPPEFSSQTATKLTFDVPEGGAKDADFSL
jgi:hypothetical protein